MMTSLYAGLLAVFYVALSLHVIRGRWKFRVGIGDGGHSELSRRIRVHGNFAENVPFCLFLLYLNEISGATILWVHALGCLLILGRLCHAYAINKTSGVTLPRTIGVSSTLIVFLIAGLRLIIVR